MNDASRRLGEKASEYYASGKNWERVFPPQDNWPSKSGEFDLVYREKQSDGTDKYIVVEAKGGREKYGELGTRQVRSLVVEQGTRPYFDDTINSMNRKGLSKN
jgi:Holliday junction resolvase-like predicted endonuclease